MIFLISWLLNLPLSPAKAFQRFTSLSASGPLLPEKNLQYHWTHPYVS